MRPSSACLHYALLSGLLFGNIEFNCNDSLPCLISGCCGCRECARCVCVYAVRCVRAGSLYFRFSFTAYLRFQHAATRRPGIIPRRSPRKAWLRLPREDKIAATDLRNLCRGRCATLVAFPCPRRGDVLASCTAHHRRDVCLSSWSNSLFL